MAPGNKLNASFGGPLPLAGDIGYFSQSGSLLAAIVDMARDLIRPDSAGPGAGRVTAAARSEAGRLRRAPAPPEA